MAQLNLSHTLVAGTPENINDVQDNFQDVVDHVNNALIGTDNLTDGGVTAAKLADAAKLGLTAGATVRRGKSIIATEEARTNTAYGLLATPDRVSGIVLPADGLICVAYRARWKRSVNTPVRAAIFLGANQLQTRHGVAGTVTQAARLDNVSDVGQYTSTLMTAPIGLVSEYTPTVTATDATTGVALGTTAELAFEAGSTALLTDIRSEPQGGPVYIWAAAGTYDISVQFKSNSGTVTVIDRKLWVWTMGF